MDIYSYESAFGAVDVTGKVMRQAVADWFSMYYQQEADESSDPCQRIAYAVVSKLCKSIFGEYDVRAEGFAKQVADALDEIKKEAMQLALVGGECYLKPCFGAGISFALIPRDRVLIFGRNAFGEPVDVGTVQLSSLGGAYYTLLERRSVDENGYLTIENRLYRSKNGQSLGSPVALSSHPDYAALADKYRYTVPVGSVGLVRLRTPVVNCVDGSADGVAVYAAAVGLIRNIDRNEAQLGGEFDRGESRIIVSADMLRQGALADKVFVGLDDDPQQVGLTVFSPALREQSFLARKQEYLRNVESIIGLKRGMLSDANMDERTATEIAASAGEFNLTVIDFQAMWQGAVGKTLELCRCLGRLYALAVDEDSRIDIDWGNGVLYDEDKTWESYRQMVADGLLKPEIALGWRFNMPAQTESEQALVRKKLMANSLAQ